MLPLPDDCVFQIIDAAVRAAANRDARELQMWLLSGVNCQFRRVIDADKPEWFVSHGYPTGNWFPDAHSCLPLASLQLCGPKGGALSILEWACGGPVECVQVQHRVHYVVGPKAKLRVDGDPESTETFTAAENGDWRWFETFVGTALQSIAITAATEGHVHFAEKALGRLVLHPPAVEKFLEAVLPVSRVVDNVAMMQCFYDAIHKLPVPLQPSAARVHTLLDAWRVATAPAEQPLTEWLCPDAECCLRVFYVAAFTGSFERLQYLHATLCQDSHDLEPDDLEPISELAENALFEQAASGAVRGGHLHILDWVFSSMHPVQALWSGEFTALLLRRSARCPKLFALLQARGLEEHLASFYLAMGAVRIIVGPRVTRFVGPLFHRLLVAGQITVEHLRVWPQSPLDIDTIQLVRSHVPACRSEWPKMDTLVTHDVKALVNVGVMVPESRYAAIWVHASLLIHATNPADSVIKSWLEWLSDDPAPDARQMAISWRKRHGDWRHLCLSYRPDEVSACLPVWSPRYPRSHESVIQAIADARAFIDLAGDMPETCGHRWLRPSRYFLR